MQSCIVVVMVFFASVIPAHFSLVPLTANQDEMFMSYPSVPAESLPAGVTNLSATVTYKASSAVSVCFDVTSHTQARGLNGQTHQEGFGVQSVSCRHL